MDVEKARSLARYRDISLEATAFRLRAVRMALGVSQKDMAAALELPTSTYADYERARVYPSQAVVSHFRWHRECPAFCVRDCRSMLRGKDSVDHGEEDRRLDTGRAAEGLRAA